MPHRQSFRQHVSDPVARQWTEAIRHHKQGRLIEAERSYRAVLDLAPHHYDALRLLGTIYLQNGKSEQALPLFQRALQAQPQNPEILNSLGIALASTGRAKEAATYFRQALENCPTHVEALHNLGRVLRELGNVEAALDCYLRAIQSRGNNPEACFQAGWCQYEMGAFEQAVVSFKNALDQRPRFADALGGLAATLWAMGRRAEARTKLERALEIEPGNAKLMVNLGEFLYDETKVSEALEYYNRALACAPEYPVALWRKSFALLSVGEYNEGWKLYAACLGDSRTRGPNLFAPKKPWDGRAISGTLLIWCEQGLGDSLQFIRYAELCKKRVGKVFVYCPKPLVRLFKGLPFIDDAFDTILDQRIFDEHVPVMNLPYLFDTTLQTVPADVPYLRVDSAMIAKWVKKFSCTDDCLRVGLVWAGGAHEGKVTTHLIDRQRSLGLDRLKPWLDLQGARFYSLQKDIPDEQIGALGLADRVTSFMDEVVDFADTAAIVQNLDLVISVDTSVAHLAGGLGKPVWIMSRANADWRWLQNRPSSPWYPTARIFGQTVIGNWDGVIAEVRCELAREVSKKSLPPSVGGAPLSSLPPVSSKPSLEVYLSSALSQSWTEATAHHKAGRLAEAERGYRAVLEAEPQHGDALRLLGAIYVQTGRSGLAVPLLETAAELFPRNPEILNSLGVALATLGREAEAIARFRQVLDVHPGYVGALNNLGHALRKQGKFAESLEYYERSYQMMPNHPQTACELGRCHYDASNFEQAARCFERMLSQKQDDIRGIMGLAAVFLATGRMAEAEWQLTQALSMAPEHLRPAVHAASLMKDAQQLRAFLARFGFVLPEKSGDTAAACAGLQAQSPLDRSA